MDTIIQPVTLPSKRGTYRRHSDDFKRAVVAQSLAGTSVARVAREHGVNANQVFAWRRKFGDVQPGTAAAACTFLPVAITAAAPTVPAADREDTQPGIIELTVGQARLRLEGAVDMTVLALVLQRLLS